MGEHIYDTMLNGFVSRAEFIKNLQGVNDNRFKPKRSFSLYSIFNFNALPEIECGGFEGM